MPQSASTDFFMARLRQDIREHVAAGLSVTIETFPMAVKTEVVVLMVCSWIVLLVGFYFRR